FNLIGPGDRDRRLLEFGVAWTGWWRTTGGAHTVYIDAPGAVAQVAVDAAPVFDDRSSQATATVQLSAGWHRLDVTLISPYGAPRIFSAGEVVAGRPMPFDAAASRTDRIDRRQARVATLLAAFKPTADIIALGWLAAIASLLALRRVGELWQHPRCGVIPALHLFTALSAVEAFRFASPWRDRLRVMVGGDDSMVYEAYARDILLNGVLMNGGAPPGSGEPFYFQALYPYFLAALHAVFGESMFGPLLVQRLLVAVTVIVLTRMAMRLRGDTIWPAALVLSALFLWWKVAPISADFLNESLYVPLLAAATLALLALNTAPSLDRAMWAGILCGLAALTRTTALLGWAIAWPTASLGLPKHMRTRLVTVGVACLLGLFSMIAIRNALVSHRFAPMPTEFGITLLGGNQPPPGLNIDAAGRGPLYASLGLDGNTAQVIEYALTAPGGFIANLTRKALFAIGLYEPYAPGWGYSPVYMAVVAFAVYGVLLLRGTASPLISFLPLLVALTQFAAVVLVYPKVERLILPIHVLLVPYATVGVTELVAGLQRRGCNVRT
ncbi:MAG: hypothetical protein ACKOEC_19365, partial [Acidimicrobiia bacterium]